MHPVELQVGQALTLTPETGGESHPAKVSSTAPDRLRVELPGAEAWRPSPGTRVQVSFAAKDGLGVFSSLVLDGDDAGGIALEAPRSVEQVQRRRFSRYPLRLKVACVPLPEGLPPGEGFEAQTLDIGGNGLVIASGQPLSVGERVRLELHLHGYGDFSGVGQVRRAEPSGENEGEYLAGLEFVEVAEDDRAALLAYAHAHGETASIAGWF